MKGVVWAYSKEWAWKESNQEKTSPELLNLAPKHGPLTTLQTIITSSVSVLHFSCQIFYFFNFSLCTYFFTSFSSWILVFDCFVSQLFKVFFRWNRAIVTFFKLDHKFISVSEFLWIPCRHLAPCQPSVIININNANCISWWSPGWQYRYN